MPLARQQKGSPEIPSRDSTVAETLICIITALKKSGQPQDIKAFHLPAPSKISLNKSFSTVGETLAQILPLLPIAHTLLSKPLQARSQPDPLQTSTAS